MTEDNAASRAVQIIMETLNVEDKKKLLSLLLKIDDPEKKKAFSRMLYAGLATKQLLKKVSSPQ